MAEDQVSNFSIAIDDQAGEAHGGVFGRIVVGDWSELFELSPSAHLPGLGRTWNELWMDELDRLSAGAAAVALPSGPSRAWVLYREDSHVFVQEHLYRTTEWPGEVSPDGEVKKIPPRQMISEGGSRVSEWRTSVEEVRSFLAANGRGG